MINRVAWLSGPGPDGQPGRWPLEKEAFVIGRLAPADLVLPYPRLSRRHARLTRTTDGYLLEDLDSHNGTFVNGEPLGQTPHRLIDDDELVLGGVVAFRFHDPEETQSGPRLGRLRGVWIDRETKDVWVDGRLITSPLSPPQLALLISLYEAKGRPVAREELATAVWPTADPAGISEEAIDGLVKRLRGRLRETQPLKEYIQVVRGYGLRLVQPD